ncbi:hypothetical protein NMY22_g13125 [Coprinellus aureogranulatus]|nr:hypothetical protein NMY22_g13125 [Coprinellus aureogranulatus]
MRLDIVYEILGHLLPTDLLNVSALNKSWQKILFSTRAASVWKTARMGVRITYPEPPEGFTEQTWAPFPFGMANVCRNCGYAQGVKEETFLDERLVTERRFLSISTLHPHSLSHSIVDGGWEYNRSKEYYWDDEIKQAAAQRALFPKGGLHLSPCPNSYQPRSVLRAATASSFTTFSSAFSKVTASAFSERPLEFLLLVLLGLICTELALERGPLSFLIPSGLSAAVIDTIRRSAQRWKEAGHNTWDFLFENAIKLPYRSLFEKSSPSLHSERASYEGTFQWCRKRVY